MIRPLNEHVHFLEEIAHFLGLENSEKISIRGISSNSKEVEPGDLFIAIPGKKSHGAEFIEEAKNKGAAAVLTDSTGAEIVAKRLPIITVNNVRNEIGPLSSWFYDYPSTKFNLFGITGTNGKTTTSYLLNQIWKSAGKSTAFIGTLGVEICGEIHSIGFTTPEADELANTLASAAERNVTQAVMEVSSIAIEMGRVAGTKFKCAAFSNLTQDHLDFHGSMENYGLAKAKLFDLTYTESAVINIDDEFGYRLYENSKIPAVSISRSNKKATWHYSKILNNKFKTDIAIRGEGGILIESEISLVGEHNLDNLILAVALAFHSGVDPLVIAASLPNLKGAPGRMEPVNAGQDFLAIVDYAHTPDAVTRSLEAARKLSNRVIAVLGCGGDRDSSKRAIMGSELSKGSNLSIFTSDNPRSENPETILDEMMKNVSVDDSNIRIKDRREAIAFAVANAKSGDCIIVLGKGHELGQEISGQKFPFDDRIELAKAIEGLT